MDGLCDDLACRIDIVAPRIGELDIPTGPDEQARTEMALELRDFPADARQRRVQLAASRRQAAGIDDRQKNLHRIEAVHQAPHSFAPAAETLSAPPVRSFAPASASPIDGPASV